MIKAISEGKSYFDTGNLTKAQKVSSGEQSRGGATTGEVWIRSLI